MQYKQHLKADRNSKRHFVLALRSSPPWSPRASSPGDYALPTARGARLAPPPEQRVGRRRRSAAGDGVIRGDHWRCP